MFDPVKRLFNIVKYIIQKMFFIVMSRKKLRGKM